MQLNPSGSFLQTCINFVQQRLKFFHFEGSILVKACVHNFYQIFIFHQMIALQKL